jgi:hypothetical protein
LEGIVGGHPMDAWPKCITREKAMNDLTVKLIIALVFVPVLLAIFRGPAEMTAAGAAIAVALFFANIDKFARFKGGGIEAEMRTAVTEAYAAIAQLRELGVALSGPIVDEMAVSGRMLQYLPLKGKLERAAKIEETLRKLGASESEVEEATSTLYYRVINDHIIKILYSLKGSNPGKEALFEGLSDGKMNGWDKAKLDKFIKDNNLKTSDDAAELFQDLDFFLKNKRLRREELWQS